MNEMVGPDLLRSGIFTVSEVAGLVQAAPAAVRLWVAGRKGRQSPIIDNDLGEVGGKVAVSFTNLMELRFIAQFHNAGVRLNEIRAIMDEAKILLGHPHPTATKIVFKTDGKKILAKIGKDHGVALMYDLRSKNYEMPTIVMQSLREDVEFDKDDNMVAWYPRQDIAPNVVIRPSFSFGRPALAKSSIPVETLANAVKAEGNARTVARLYDVPEKQVREAVRFYEDLRKAA